MDRVKKRKILVFAHVPPPHHGQSVMVQIMLEGLRADPRFEVHHVDALEQRDTLTKFSWQRSQDLPTTLSLIGRTSPKQSTNVEPSTFRNIGS